MWTYRDAVQHVLDIGGASTDGTAKTLAKTAVQLVYRELSTISEWSYFRKTARLVIEAAYSTGTIEYDNSGGASERLITLTSGTWPTWTARGQIYISGIWYDVATRESSTTLTLGSTANPGADVASGTSYTLSRSRYTMPVDYRAGSRLVDLERSWTLDYVTPQTLNLAKVTRESSNDPRMYTIINDPDYVGALAVEVYPPPLSQRVFDYVYMRRQLPMSIEGYETGTVAITAASASVVGTGTAWTSAMIGSVIRLGDTSDVPTGIQGLTPFIEERIVTAVGSATTLTLDTAVTNTYSAAKYVISSLVDMDEAVMLPAFITGCEAVYARMTRDSGYGMLQQAYMGAIQLARGADVKNIPDIDTGWYPASLGDYAVVE